MTEDLACISCGTYFTASSGFVKFECPECGNIIVRCERCRTLGKNYICKCGFSGP